MTIRASVIIPTHNRKDSLRDVLRSILAQTVPVEIIVLDDCSPDATGDMVRSEFPNVRYERSERNVGPTVLRNCGARMATTDFLFTIDDDCVLVDPVTIEQTLASFDEPRIGAVTIPFRNVRHADSGRMLYGAPDASDRYVTSMFYGGMIAFRRDAYLAVDGYREFYFMHVEEPDLAIRLMDAGYLVRLGTAPPIHHMESPKRNQIRLHRLGPRNHLLYTWYNVPFPEFFWHMPATLLLTFWHTVKVGYPLLGASSVVKGLVDCVRQFSARRPVRRSTYRLSRSLRRGATKLSTVESQLPPRRGVPL